MKVVSAGWIVLLLAAGCTPGTGGDGAQASASPSPEPSPVSFALEVVPSFPSRGCSNISCHSQLEAGGLGLAGTCNEVYAELMDPATMLGVRVSTSSPNSSLLLTFPVSQGQIDSSDPILATWLRWIEEGASNNCP